MAPKNNAKGGDKAKAAKGKGNNAANDDTSGKGKGKGGLKAATAINVRHILVSIPCHLLLLAEYCGLYDSTVDAK